MEREHLVSTSVTNGEQCICNPEILLGTKYGLWDIEKQQAPRGTLLDLNAAWELFLSKQEFDNDVSFKEEYYHQHTVVEILDDDGNVIGTEVFEDGDTKYTLLDNGKETKASFVIKANKGPVEHIEWDKGVLILYYTKTRPRNSEDVEPLHYVTDSDGNVIIDPETGQPLIYDYVRIPVIEIFDNDETHKLFPWFADDQHTVRLRQTLDDPSDTEHNHLGDVAITSESEIFVAPTRYAENEGNTLISIQSAYQKLKETLGLPETTYEDVSDLVDTEGNSTHKRVKSYNVEVPILTQIENVLTQAKRLHELIDGTEEEVPDNHTPEGLSNLFKTHINNIVEVLNFIQDTEIGNFEGELNQLIDADTITEALNFIFDEAEANKERIGWKNNQWIALTTRDNTNLSDAINEIDQHADELAKIAGVTENWDPSTKRTFYDSDNLNNITKNRLGEPKKLHTLIEAINELQSQIGNLDSSKSFDNTHQLRTDEKTNLVLAINEVDTHADNNFNTIGASYTTDANGVKNSDISNLTTNNKTSIVNAINELDDRVGELENLSTDDKTNIVSAINEVIAESPIVYEDTTEPNNSGIKLKDSNNTAGTKSLVIGINNESGDYSFVSGESNQVSGQYQLVSGAENSSQKQFNLISGAGNQSNGFFNLVNGESNVVKGDHNLVSGRYNVLSNTNRSIISGTDNQIDCNNVVALGSGLQAKGDNNIVIGGDSQTTGNNSVSIGASNISGTASTVIGNGSQLIGSSNYFFGEENVHQGDASVGLGRCNRSTGTEDTIIGIGNVAEGNFNSIFGREQQVTGNRNIVIDNTSKSYNVNNAVIIGGINEAHNNATHIGREIYVQTHDTESNLQKLIFVDLNDWCKLNNASSLNGEKFLDSSHLVAALKTYLTHSYTDKALLRFQMQNENENGFILVQGQSKRIFINGTWYSSNDIEHGWSRQEGEYLKVIKKVTTDTQGNTINKYYLAFMNQQSTENIVDTVGAQRSNSEDFRSIDLTHAYGAVDFDDISVALDLDNRFKEKVDKTAKIITKFYEEDGNITEKYQNFIDPDNPNLSANITLSLKESFGFDKNKYQLLSEKGQANGYVPLNSQSQIDSRYLPSYVDDVIEVWAEYNIDSITGQLYDIALYEIVVRPSGVQERGQQIISGETGKIYVEANESERPTTAQFRWSGSQWVPIGFSHLVLGEVEGTAYDGLKGHQTRLDLDDHLKSGTTTVTVENPDHSYSEVVYKPNPHNVKAEQLNVTITDPNNPNNPDPTDDTYSVRYNVLTALQTLFTRLNTTEDTSDSVSALLGTALERQKLDDLNVDEYGNPIRDDGYPTVIGTLLEVKEKLDAFTPVSSASVNQLVDENFNLLGDD